MEAFEERLGAGNATFYACSHLVTDKDGKFLVACFSDRPLDDPTRDYVPPKKQRPLDSEGRKKFNRRREEERKGREVCTAFTGPTLLRTFRQAERNNPAKITVPLSFPTGSF